MVLHDHRSIQTRSSQSNSKNQLHTNNAEQHDRNDDHTTLRQLLLGIHHLRSLRQSIWSILVVWVEESKGVSLELDYVDKEWRAFVVCIGEEIHKYIHEYLSAVFDHIHDQ